MNKKLAILLVVKVMVVIYLGLLVGMPALAEKIGGCGDCGDNETADSSSVSNVTGNWTPLGPALDLRPYSERLKPPVLVYFIPGLVGIAVIVQILKQKTN